jgi:hypothetical protein
MATPAKLVNPIDLDFTGYLDPDFIDYWNTRAAIRPATHQSDFASVRADPGKFRGKWYKDYSDQPRVKTVEIESGDGYRFKVRSYHPDPEVFGPGPYPVNVNYHGRYSASNLAPLSD